MDSPSTVSKRKLLSRPILFPSSLFLLFCAVNLALVIPGPRKYDNLLRVSSQWDGQHYQSIAGTGYEYYPCPTPPPRPCGNAGWFPMYPLVAKGFNSLGIDIRWSMIIVSWLALWLALILLYRLLRYRFDEQVAAFGTLFLLLFPTSFYYLAAFPYSLYLLLALSVFTLLAERRYGWLWLPCAMLAVTYPSGALIGIPVLYELVSRFRSLNNRQRLLLMASLLALPVAILIYFCYYWIKFDDFFLYMTYQAHSIFGHKLSFPLVTLAQSFAKFPLTHPEILAIFFGFGSFILFFSKRLPIPWMLYLAAILLFTPTFGTTQCYYRHIVIAFPLGVMVALQMRTKRRWLVPLYAIAAIALYASVYFPLFKLGTLM